MALRAPALSLPPMPLRVPLATGFALVLALWWLAGIGLAPLFDVDEGAFAEASREMLASGDWGHTTLNGADRFDKPILVYWLQAGSLALFGPTVFAVRLPSALCAWGWCLAVAAFAAPRWGRQAALCAAAVLATSLGPVLIGRAATADALLNGLLTLTLLDLWRFVESPRAAPLRRAFLWAGLGLLAKGPVAVVIPLGTLLVWAAASGRPGWRVLGAALRDRLAWAIGAAVALPWYAYAWQRHGEAFIDGFFVHHNLERFAGPLEGHGGSWLYYGAMLPLTLWPWAPLLPALARQGRALWVDPVSRFLLCWALFVLVFFSFAGTKLPHYVLYGLAPWALLGGRLLATGAMPRSLRGAIVAAAALLVAFGAASPALAAWAADRASDNGWRALLEAAAALPAPAPAVAAAAVAGLLVLAWGLREQPGLSLLAAAAVSTLWVVTQLVPWWSLALQRPVRTLALEARQRGLPLVQWQLHRPSAAFYRGAPAPRRAPLVGEAALTWADRVPPPADAAAPVFEVVRRESAFVLVVARPVAASR